jgi:hypothetical protein
MRILDRFLPGACWLGSALAGLTHRPEWLLLMPLCLGAPAWLEDRRIRRRIGLRAWPSPAYARFMFGTNVSLLLRNALVGAALFALASAAAPLVWS